LYRYTADFVPEPDDGEVESFVRYPVKRVMELIADTTAGLYKLNPVVTHILEAPDINP
jgi:hypothetical protein